MQSTGISWRVAPCVRLVLPLIIGIIAYWLAVEQVGWLLLGGIGLLLWQMVTLYRTPHIRDVRFWGVGVQITFVGLGWWLAYGHDARQAPHFIQEHNSAQTYTVTLSTAPQLKGSTLTCLAELTQQQVEKEWRFCSGTVQLRFPIDTLSAALVYGDELAVHAVVKAIDSPKNPMAFDAQAYYAQQNIYHQAYVPSGQWIRLGWSGSIWRQHLYQLRHHLLLILEEHLPTPNEYAVGAALLLGAKEHLDRDLRNAYADTGAMHILAVSGLHIGILMGLLAFGLKGLERRGKRGKQLRVVVLLLALWGYALLTGASASVLRASTMLSFVLLGQLGQKRINIYNALAASALLLLFVDPFMVLGVGFQLSYAALLGIVYFHPKIYRVWKAPNTVLDWLWNGLAVSLAAQLATAPLSVYYFHQFPLYFWLSGVVVMAMGGLLLGIGAALLLLHAVPVLGGALGKLLYGCLWLTNSLIFGIQQLPGAVSDGWWWTGVQLFLAYGIVWGMERTLDKRWMRWALVPALGAVCWVGLEAKKIQEQVSQQQLCLHHHRGGGFLSYVQGAVCITIGAVDYNHAATRQYAQQNYLFAKGVQENNYYTWDTVVQSSTLHYQNYCVQVSHQRLAIFLPEHLHQASQAPLPVDYLWLQGNPKLYDLSALQDYYDYDHLIFDGSNPAYRRAEWAILCEQAGIAYTDLAEDGALLIDL